MTLQAISRRTTAASTESVPARLLALAEDEVRRQGFRRMRVVAIAEAAGMTHANVYRYFPSRMALADSITAAWLKPVEARLLDAATAPDPAVDKLERMTLALAQSYRDRLEQEAALFALFADAMDKSRPVARKHRAKVRDIIGRVVEEALGEDHAGRAEREKATSLLFDAAHRFLHPASLLQDKDAPRAIFDQRLGLLLGVTLRYFRARAREVQN